MNLKPNATQGLTAFAGSTLGKLIGGRKTTDDGVGNALSTIGNTAGFILPGWLGAGVSAGFNILGGGYNAMFGYEKNNEAIAKVDSELNALNGLKFNASNTNDLINQSNFSLIDSVNNKLGEDGLFSSKIKNLENEYNRKIALANEQALSNFSLSARNLDNMNDKKLLANYSAYGGPITMEYTGIMSPFGNRFDFGGELNTQGADFTNGLLHINNGGSHESNPYEGVPMGADAEGTPNLVEEGETVFNDYVFSNRIAVPKAIRDKYKLRGNKKITFAEASKKLAKESEERPNDPISKRGLEASMQELMMAQEMIKEKENNIPSNKFQDGGKKKNPKYLPFIAALPGAHFDKDGNYLGNSIFGSYKSKAGSFGGGEMNGSGTGGRFTLTPRYSNMTFNEAFDAATEAGEPYFWYGEKLYNTNKELNPIREINNRYVGNSKERSKLKKEDSYDYQKGPVSYQGVENIPIVDDNRTKIHKKSINNKFATGGWTLEEALEQDQDSDVVTRTTKNGTTVVVDDKSNNKTNNTMPPPKARDIRLRYTPAVGLGLMTLTDALGWTNKPNYGNADAIINLGVNASSAPPKVGWSPINNYLRYNPFDTMFYGNQLAAQANATRRAIINNSNGNRMTAITGLLGSDYNYQKNLSNLYREAEEYNLEQRQKVEDFNRATNMANAEGFMKAALANQDAEMKARSLGLEAQMAGYKMREATRLAAEEDRAANLSGFINALGNIGKDNATSNQIKFAIATGNPIGKDLLKLLDYKKGGYLKKKKKRGLTY